MFITEVKRIILGCTLLALFSCVKGRDFDPIENRCEVDLEANISYQQLKSLYQEETFQIQENLVIEGYIISSDEKGNFFSTLYFQDKPTKPTQGFQIEIDARDTHLFYPEGTKIFIKLKDLYLGKSKDVFKIGGVFSAFGNLSVGRLPAAAVDDHIFVSCDERSMIEPTMVSIDNLQTDLTNTLVRIVDLEISEDDLDKSYAVEREETNRTLIDCADNELGLRNSGFSDFQSDTLPKGNGAITGVLLRERDEYFLAIRNLNDIDFVNDRCIDFVDEFTSTNIFISELADPNNNLDARFIELYNAGDDSFSLKGWLLGRYTNANTELSSIVDLSDYSIAAKDVLVIAANAVEFRNVYGFEPDLEASGNSPANSNGDDNIELIDPFGAVIDIFGVVGEDGTQTNHEFEDGRAVRNSNISQGNAIFTFAEWTIYNDSGDSGTTNQPQNAPEDFSPGIRD